MWLSLTKGVPMSLLAEETESVEESPGHFRGRISGNWSVNGNPNGGYLTAIMVEAALRKSAKKSTPIVTADSLPPGILASHGMVAWVPTIELTVNIRNLPKSRWLNCSLRTRFVTCGLLEADGEVWDEKGNLVAISRQIAQIRTG